MAAKNAKSHEKFAAPETPAQPEAERIDEWVPDYGRHCEACGQTPCVTGVRDGVVVYAGKLCGVCTWGEPSAIDPANW